jgi:hypothetical protein
MSQRPLNAKQKLFGRELGIALAEGKKPEDAYERAGYRRHRRNAFRLATDKRVQAIADATAAEALRLNGLHLAYLQAKTLGLFELNAFKTFYERGADGKATLRNLADVADEHTWAITKFTMDPETGRLVDIEVPDKLAAFNALLKTMPKGMAPVRTEISGPGGAPIQTVDLSNASDDQLAALEAVFGPLAVAGAGDEGDPGGTQ